MELDTRVKKLLNQNQCKQKSKEWTTKRGTMITASSDVCNIITSKTGNSQQVIRKKTTPYKHITSKYMEHGIKYEQIASSIYEQKTNKKVFQLGLLEHKTIPHLGASPDGITNDGRLIEIKVPTIRTIDGSISKKYFVQMQTQMEVCDIDVCDFVECKIREYNTYVDYLGDGCDRLTKSNLPKGCIGVNPGIYNVMSPQYFYPPFEFTTNEQIWWLLDKREQLQESHKRLFVKYWHLVEYSCQEVKRDKKWWADNNITESIAKCWASVESVLQKSNNN